LFDETMDVTGNAPMQIQISRQGEAWAFLSAAEHTPAPKGTTGLFSEFALSGL
jgi:hypothetical protein